MSYTRRGFLKLAGVSALCLSLSQFGFNLGEAQAYAGSLKIEGAKEVITICPFCAVCCQVIAYVRDGKLVSTEGDPDFPVNEGALCAKGAALFSMYTNPHRLTKPLYRAPYSEKWEEKDWGWMLEKIARRVKDTRDKDLILKNSKGQTVNRLESIFMMGTSHASNEECAVIHQAGSCPNGPPGPGLTQPHCCGSGRVVRTRCYDQPLDRHQECRRGSYYRQQCR